MTVLAQHANRMGQEMEDNAFLLGGFHFLVIGGHLVARNAGKADAPP